MFQNLIAPLARRLGTWTAGAVGGLMVVSPEIAESIEGWVVITCGLGVDLVASYLDRKGRK